MKDGQVILITGTSTGFGRLMAEDLARKGHTVFASMRDVSGRNATNSSQLRNLAEREGLSLHVIEMDVTSDASVDKSVTEVIERTGQIDVLINNAGVGYVGLIEAFTLEQVQRQFDTNFFGVVRMNRAVLPYMRRRGSGLLIYISSGAGRRVLPFGALYSASKFALEALAEGYHYQLHKLSIDSVIIQPGQYPSAAPNNFVYAADQTRAAEYGQVAELLEKSTANFIEGYSSPGAPDPQEVVNAVAEVIALPTGKRPLRPPVGQSGEGLKVTNEMMAQGQASLMERLGLTELMKAASDQPADE